MSPPQRRGGRVHGAEGYHKEDIMALLKCVRDVVPTKTEEWDQVLTGYRKTHAIPNTRSQRDTNSLKVKFKQLARQFRPGESVRPELLEAGSILELIEAKMAGSQCLQRRGGRARGAEGFSAADSQAILKTVRQILPVNRANWEQVAEEYCRVYSIPNDRLSRDGISLKSKFRNLLKNDVGTVPRAEISEAIAIQMEISAKMNQGGMNDESMEDLRPENVVINESVEDVEERNIDETEIIALDATYEHEDCTANSKGKKANFVADLRRGGRVVGSEGYSQSDKWALLSCIKDVLPSGPTSWERVLQLYRMNHATPNDRAQRNLTGIKSKFRQLVNWKHGTGTGKMVPEETLQARAIQRDIDLRLTLGKRQRSGSESNVSFSHTPEESFPDAHEEHSILLTHAKTRKNENVERQDMVVDVVERPVSAEVPASELMVNRSKDSISAIDDPEDCDGDSARQIASRELELLRQREQREAEQAAWEKERTMREKQRMDMEAWTIVCDRLRALYRERATENNPEIVSEFDDEIAVLKKKKQRLASLMI
ncbi:unnamed protein product [Peronospora belbahrii]|uniref:Myb-like domain-containing protein n=1 Tax=Peronospora belbahrii TaxID=622444 RepID=A0AAU9KZQ7_9STRA|nr:unnamed protein product [Peronospora belbahrii]CAH0519191.1 unnamed protein product [Peronospora belbahrii]